MYFSQIVKCICKNLKQIFVQIVAAAAETAVLAAAGKTRWQQLLVQS